MKTIYALYANTYYKDSKEPELKTIITTGSKHQIQALRFVYQKLYNKSGPKPPTDYKVKIEVEEFK